MSIKREQYYSLKLTREFLFEILSMKSREIKLSTLKQKASRCLRHYPALRDSGEPVFSKN